jgi:hypothetical protein
MLTFLPRKPEKRWLLFVSTEISDEDLMEIPSESGQGDC